MVRREKRGQRIACEALIEIQNARHAVQVLLASHSAGMKRKLGLGYAGPQGYAGQRDATAKYVIDGAFHLAVLAQVVDRHPFVAREFLRDIKAADSLLSAMDPFGAGVPEELKEGSEPSIIPPPFEVKLNPGKS